MLEYCDLGLFTNPIEKSNNSKGIYRQLIFNGQNNDDVVNSGWVWSLKESKKLNQSKRSKQLWQSTRKKTRTQLESFQSHKEAKEHKKV